MSDPDGPSMDPRTWLDAKPKAGEPPPDKTSFDPRAWGLQPKAPAVPMGRSRAGLVASAVAALFLILAGGGVWLFAHGGVTFTLAKPPPVAPPPTGEERRALTVSDPGELTGALTGAGVLPAQAAQVAQAASAKIAPGAGDLTVVMMIAPANGGYRLVSLDARHDNGAGVVVKAAEDGSLTATPTAADLKTVIKVVRGEMDAYSFYSSAVAQHLTDTLISPFAQALSYDFDFQREIHAGDVFEAVFEDRENARGQSVGAGRLLYVSMETPAKSRALYWFQPAGGQGGWFDGNGSSTVRALLRTPVEGARISSTFGMREHPILGYTKMHEGVDFAAPIGTPIYAAGDGVILHAEMKALNGNYVEIQHDNGWLTYYLHMSAFGPGIAPGVRVHQGQEIGQIGTTGRSTGPHVHYALKINGQFVDPMGVKMEAAQPLTGAQLAAFVKERNRIDALRAAQTG
ncbi:MAG: peptidoglycan DD-metalloendopeptidase family protein [Caulobacteraceae bacterium]